MSAHDYSKSTFRVEERNETTGEWVEVHPQAPLLRTLRAAQARMQTLIADNGRRPRKPTLPHNVRIIEIDEFGKEYQAS